MGGPSFAQGLPAAGDDSDTVSVQDTVFVTATKREQSILDVPIAVSAISEQQIERTGVKDLKDLPILSPSLSLHYSQTESQGLTLRLRGIGTTGNNIGLESSVGVFLDGIHLSRPSIALGDMLDLEQIEVLRGPQGTLFGRNTSAGAINIRTRRPNMDEFESFANVGVGNFGAYNLQAGANFPLIEDELAVRISGAYRKQDGLLESTTGVESNTRDRYSLRGQLLWEPSDNFDLRLIADYSDTDEECCDAPIILDPLNGSGVFDAAGLPSDGGVARFGENAVDDLVSNAGQFENPMEQWGFSGEANWDLGFGALTYLGGYRNFKAPTVQDVDFVALDVVSGPGPSSGFTSFDEISTFTSEVRLQGVNGPLDWLVGAYFGNEEIEEVLSYEAGADYSRYLTASAWYGLFYAPGGVYDSLSPADQAALDATSLPAGTTPTFGAITAAAVAPPVDLAELFAGGASADGFFGVNQFQQDGTSWSVFTHNTLALSDALDLTAGLRWASEEKDGSYDQIASGNAASCFNAQQNAQAIATAGGAGYSDPAVDELLGGLSIGLAQLACFPFFAPVDPDNPLLPQEYDLSFEDEELVYSAALAYDLDPNTNFYLSLAHGFKSGGFNLDSTAASLGADPRFESEIIDSYEAGLKSVLFDGVVNANVAAFFMDIENFQVLDFNGVQFRTFNVPKVKSDGVEVDVTATPTDYLTLTGAVTYADTRYPDDCASGLDGAPVQITTLCGSRLLGAPLWTSVVGATLEGPVFDGGLNAFVSGTVRYESERRTGTRAIDVDTGALLPFDVQEENARVNLRAGIGSLDERWTVELWANNVFDERTRAITFNVPLRGLGLAGTATRGTFIEEPRTFGITLRTRY